MVAGNDRGFLCVQINKSAYHRKKDKATAMPNLLFIYWTSVVLMLTLEGMLVNMLKMLGA